MPKHTFIINKKPGQKENKLNKHIIRMYSNNFLTETKMLHFKS